MGRLEEIEQRNAALVEHLDNCDEDLRPLCWYDLGDIAATDIPYLVARIRELELRVNQAAWAICSEYCGCSWDTTCASDCQCGRALGDVPRMSKAEMRRLRSRNEVVLVEQVSVEEQVG